MEDIPISWENARERLAGQPIRVQCLGWETTGTIEEVTVAENMIHLVLRDPLQRRSFSTDDPVPAPYNVLSIDPGTSKVYVIDNGKQLYITLPRADHALIG